MAAGHAFGAMADVLAEFAATSSLLTALKGRPQFREVSSAEAQRLAALLQKHGQDLPREVLGQVAQKVETLFGNPPDKELLLDAVAVAAVGKAAGPEQTKVDCGRALQDWTNLALFLRKSVWEKLRQGDTGALLDELVRMGLRRPSEPTMQTVSLVALAATDGVASVAAMDPQTKLTFIQACKGMFKTRLKGVSPPTDFVLALPTSPDELSTDVRRAWYGKEDPAPSEVSESELAQLRATTRMRGVKRMASAVALPPPAATSQVAQQLCDLLAAAMGGLAQQAGRSEPVIHLNTPSQRRLHLQLPQLRALAPVTPPPLRTARSASFELGEGGEEAGGTVEAQVAQQDLPLAPNSSPLCKQTPDPVVAGSSPPSMDSITQSILEKMQSKKRGVGQTGAAQKQMKGSPPKGPETKPARAQTKGTPPKGPPKAQQKKTRATGPTEKKSKQKGRNSVPAPDMPKVGKRPPIRFLTCTIYSDESCGCWRAIEDSNRRKDKKRRWSGGQVAWDELIRWCREQSAAADRA